MLKLQFIQHISYSLMTTLFRQVGSSNGSLHTLTSPSLSKLSRYVVFDSFRLDLILSSPDKKWILTASKESSDFSPKV